MTRLAIAYAATLSVLVVADLIWLGIVARRLYVARMGDMLLAEPRLGVAAAFYCLYTVGIMYFAVLPACRAESLVQACIHGALFGLFAYATYNLTNLAVLRNWPVGLSLMDMAWGTVLTSAAAIAGYAALRQMVP